MADFVMSDYWCIDGDVAFFISTWTKALYRIDLDTRVITYLDTIPDDKVSMHLYILCLKYGDYLYVFPDLGENVYKFDLRLKMWNSIYKGYFKGKRAGIKLLYQEERRAILFSRGFNTVFEFDLSIPAADKVAASDVEVVSVRLTSILADVGNGGDVELEQQ